MLFLPENIFLSQHIVFQKDFILLHSQNVKQDNFNNMYAIVEIAGQQFKVTKDQKIFVHRLEGDEGASLEFDKVLLVDNEGAVKVGTPVVEGAKVSGKILTHLRGDKVFVFKKKRRKGYKKFQGHRQDLTQVQIESITA